MSNNTAWAGPRLLIPVTVDALVVTNAGNATQFSIQPLSLSSYSKFLNISPNLFSQTEQLSAGVYLNWALPDGMTNGLADDDGKVEYPHLPNRWMIVRFSPDAAVARQAWIVESDWLGDIDSPTEGGPTQPQYLSGTDNAQVKSLGKWYDMDTWQETGQTSELFLTAVGNSDPLFAAYSGNNTFVFSFVDKFDDPNARTMSYMVSGWYSNPLYDILYDKPTATSEGWKTEQDWLDLMTRLQWSVGEQTIDNEPDLDNAMAAAAQWLQKKNITPLPGLEGTLCAQTLCHGLVFGVNWPGNNVAPPSEVPVYNTDPKTVSYVAAGNAATDCLSAFMQWQLNYNNPEHGGTATDDDSEVEIMLEAFSHKMLGQDGGVLNTPELLNTIRETWFNRLPGGSVWVAQAPPKEGSLKPTDTNKTPVDLSDILAIPLAALNQLQSAYDTNYRLLVTLQKQLYADWLKLNIYQNSPFPPDEPDEATITKALADSLATVTALMNKLVTDKKTIVDNSGALSAKLANDGGKTLQEKPANDFYRPNDPVFLVNNTKRSFKRGEDIIYSQYNDYLFTRFSGQFISSLQVGTINQVVKASAVCPPFVNRPDIPAEVSDLLAEAYLLDTTFAQAIASRVANPSQALIDQVKLKQTLIWNDDTSSTWDKQTLEELSGFNPGDKLFHVPSKVGVWQWNQPWTPLYLEWQIGFSPAVDSELSQWKFDGADFTWNDGEPPDPAINNYVFKGRSILTPKEAITLQSRLEDFVYHLPEPIPEGFVPLNDVVKSVGNWDVLSQTLTGFSLQLTHWNIEQFGYQPGDKVYQTAIGNEGHGMPILTSGNQFFPVRAGFVNIQQLWIVDDFGQVYNLMPGSGDDTLPPPKHMIPGIGVRTEPIQQQQAAFFQLPPRVIQGSRLNFNFLSAIDDKVLSSHVAKTTPVAGWVVPNHLNHSVMAYDNTGTYLGEIMLMGVTGAFHAQWVPAPITGTNANAISNVHLKGFINGILGATGFDEGNLWSGQALVNFMKTIDETLWSVDPMGERSNQSLSILVGRPIALVRAAINLELYGKPDYNLSWEDTGQKNSGGIETYQFPVQVGNIELAQDGVMGYFTNNNYATFNSVHTGQVTTPANPAYVVNSFTNLQFGASPTNITVLLDPRGGIHCSTGILPVLTIELPDMYIGKVLDNMLVEFKTGPLLVDETKWWVPLPAGVGQKWSWLQPRMSDQSALTWDEYTGLVAATSFAQLSDAPQTIVEGRLKLTGVLGDQLMLYFFQINDVTGSSPYSIAKNTLIQLSWSSQGTQSAKLAIGAASPMDVPANHSSYAYLVTASGTLTLTVSDGTDTQKMEIVITAT